MKMLNLAIVDDSTTDLYILSSNFKKIDYIKIKMMALNGADFIAKLENEKPDLDLLLIDLRMPVLNGIDTIKILNQMKINFKIIAMSHGYSLLHWSNYSNWVSNIIVRKTLKLFWRIFLR